jgi:hypothetical protein
VLLPQQRRIGQPRRLIRHVRHQLWFRLGQRPLAVIMNKRPVTAVLIARDGSRNSPIRRRPIRPPVPLAHASDAMPWPAPPW